MKFEYDVSPEHDECVAYIDADGDLILRDEGKIYVISQDNMFLREVHENARRRFYRGEKITITF